MITIGEVVSRIRGQIKSEAQDAFMTDRYIYSLVLKYAQLFMRRQDSANKLKKFNSVWESLPYVELIEVDKVEAECSGIQSGCTIKRTKEKLPTFMEGYWGPLIRTVSSIDGSIEMQATNPGTYISMTKTTSHRYNITKYFWYLNEYLYMPNIEWDAIKIEGVFAEDISSWICDTTVISANGTPGGLIEAGSSLSGSGKKGISRPPPVDDCIPRYLQKFNVPEFLFAEIETQVLQQMFMTLKIPPEDSDNKQNVNR